MALKLKRERGMKKHCLILILLTFLSVGFISVNTKAGLMIATFANPSKDSNPLFTVTSSAIPSLAIIVLLGFSSLTLFRRKK
jgi:hypothetical protein